MSIKQNLDKWIAELESDGMCDISDRQVSELIRSYTDLEAKCAALAAENAGLKAAIQTHSESIHFCELCGKDDPCSTDDVCMALNETPSTDAFLAEVRAQGVEMVIAYHHERSDALAEVDRNGSFRHHSAAIDATDVLMKIRLEAAQ